MCQPNVRLDDSAHHNVRLGHEAQPKVRLGRHMDQENVRLG